jgi:tetratricopeptide (TPR) repeat protein/predicted Ser/Thr protein kinase
MALFSGEVLTNGQAVTADPSVFQAAAGRNGVELLDLLRRDLRACWQHGRRLPAEAYRQRLPQLQGDNKLFLDLVWDEVLLREELGETPKLAEYEQRFPDFAEALRRQFALRQTPTLPAPESTPPPGVAETLAPLPPSKTLETVHIPGYEILKELGRGGMGVVYQARQTSVNRVVALKMILAGSHAGEQELQRFLTEAEAVAALQHPNIVQLYEFGEHDGLPYFTLEFVPGGNLADKLHGLSQPPREAARLAEQLARAMQAAHGRGIVHRDLKPANVLLAEDGTPKIADFGLAKKVNGDSGLTATGAIMGTPSYMAPEQAGGECKHVGPAADVYALGAILYEMLTGRPPFLAASPLETVQQVLTSEPVPPSHLHPKLPRDLETICLKCLQKKPGQRYAGAEALADDLGRFLAGEPIRARPVGRIERAWRWCRRNPRIAVLTATLVAVVAAGFGGVLWQWQRAENNARVADRRRGEAEDNFHLAQDAVQRCVRLVSENRQLSEPALQPLRKELLESARQFCEQFVQARRQDRNARFDLGSVLFDLANVNDAGGTPQQAVATLREAVDLGEALLREEPGNLAYRRSLGKWLNYLGVVSQLTSQVGQGEQTFRRALEVCEADTASADPECRRRAAQVHINLAKCITGQGRFAEAEQQLLTARSLAAPLVEARLELPESERALGTCWNNLGTLYLSLGQTDKSIAAQKEALKVWGASPAYEEQRATSLVKLATVYLNLGRPAEADGLFADAVPVLERLSRQDPLVVRLRVQWSQANLWLGICRHQLSRYAEAQAAYQEALRVAGRLEEDYPQSATDLIALAQGSLGLLALDRGEAEAALEWLGKAVTALEGAAQNPEAVGARYFLRLGYQHRALALLDLGREGEAAADWQRAQALDDGTAGHFLAFVRGLIDERRTGQDQTAVYREQYEQAVTEIDRPATQGYPLPSNRYLAARVCARAAAAVGQDGRLTAEQRQQRAGQYAARALRLLASARQMGYFEAAGHRQRLQQEPELQPLHDRPEFQALLEAKGG